MSEQQFKARIESFREKIKQKTPGEWIYDYGNWEIEVKEDRLPICVITPAYARAETFGPHNLLKVPCDPTDDAEFIASCSTEPEFLLNALEIAVEALILYSNRIPLNKVISPETSAFEKEYGLGRTATEALTKIYELAAGGEI